MTDLEKRFLAASEALRAGDRAGARAAFAAIIEDWPECHEAMFMAGMIEAEEGRFEEAVRLLEGAVTLDRENPDYYYRIGHVFLAMRRWEYAARAFEKAAEYGEESAQVQTDLGRAMVLARWFPEAVKAFRRALELDPSCVDACRGLIRALASPRGDLDQAAEACRMLERLLPGRAEPWARLAAVLERANDPAGAREAAERALALEPDHAEALVTLGDLEQRAGNLEGARGLLERALAQEPERELRRAALRSLGHTLDRLGDAPGAVRCIEGAKREPDELPRGMREQMERLRLYIRACRENLNEWTVACWNEDDVVPAPGEQEPVFFVGFPRSGTTLLEQMLGAHPRFVTTDERQSLALVRETIGAMGGGVDLLPDRLGQMAPDMISGARGQYFRDIASRFEGGLPMDRRLVDKQPLNTVNLCVVRRLFPRSKVIMSLRDPRDVVLSCFMTFTRSPMGAVYFRTIESSAEFYGEVMDLWLHYRRILGLDVLEVRYEDVVADAPGQMRRVLEFLGEEWDDGVLRYAERASKKQIRTASYRQVTEGIYTRSVGRWARYAPAMGRAGEVLAPYVDALGYGARPAAGNGA